MFVSHKSNKEEVKKSNILITKQPQQKPVYHTEHRKIGTSFDSVSEEIVIRPTKAETLDSQKGN